MNIKWNAIEYKDNFSFVFEYGKGVLDLIKHKKGAYVIDLGCGNGVLTNELHNKGFNVLGIDASLDMLNLAKKNFPDLNFMYADATSFQLETPADVIFSNAVFHWIDNQDDLIKNLYNNLKEEGELVFEFGGYGCAEAVHSTLEKIFKEYGLMYKRTFYFPKIGEYAKKLEDTGFVVQYATLFDRPTKQIGKDGLKNWILMFNKEPFGDIAEDLKEIIINKTVECLKDTLYIEDTWYVDYVRIRMRAIKKGM